jgi:hypothetical protein
MNMAGRSGIRTSRASELRLTRTFGKSVRERGVEPLPSRPSFGGHSASRKRDEHSLVGRVGPNDDMIIVEAHFACKRQAYGGNGTPCEGARFCMSGIFILTPLPMIKSPGFWSAAQGPSHLATTVMAIFPPGKAPLWEVTVIV